MIFFPKFLRNGLLLILLSGLFCSLSIAQTDKLSAESTSEIENQAKQLRHQWSGESFRRSIDLYSTAAANWRGLDKIENAAECLLEISRLESLSGDYKSSLQTLFDALKLLEGGSFKAEKVKIESLISIAFLRIGKVRESQKYLEESLNKAQNLADPATQATVYLSAGEFYYAKNEFEKSYGFYRKSFDLWQATGNRLFQSETLIKIAYVYMSLGEPLKGIGFARDAGTIFQEIDDKRGLATAYIAIGHLSIVMDENQTALESYFKAAAFFPDDTDLVEKARLYNGIGSVYEDYGEWQLSLDYRLKALNLFNSANYAFGQLATLHSLVKLNYLLDNVEAAEKFLSETRKLSGQLNDNYYLAITFLHVGDHHFKNFRNDEAIKYYQNSLNTFNSIRFYYWSAVSLNKLGNCYFRNGEFEKAGEFFNSSLEINRRINSKFDESESLFNIARLENSRSNFEAALLHFAQSLEITENLSSNITNSKLKRTYLSNVADRYELYINLLMRMQRQSPNGNHALRALQAVERSRARVMLENLSLSEANLIKDADPEIVKREKEIRVLLNTKADKLTDLLSNKADKSETDKISGEINELENELENVKARLKQQSPVYSAIKNPAPFDAAEFQQNVLDENSLLLEFSLGAAESYLWLVGKNEVNSYILPPRGEIEPNVETLRGLLKERGLKNGETVEDFQQRIRQNDARYETVSKELSQKLFGQIAGKLTGKRLIVVPDGELHYFPVAALPQPDSAAGDPILLTNETIYAPSAQTLSLIAKLRKQSAPAAKNLLIFSDPVFTGDDARFSPENKPAEPDGTPPTDRFRFVESLTNLPRLSASKDESETIAGIVGASGTDNFAGFRATRENLLNLKTSDYRIIHFATHGLINEERPELSGIVLSRFDEKGAKLDEFFRIQDIYGLNLNADLVVLSACETGIGKTIRGEGLMSLNNAFLQTGAKSVVATLWKVEDGATLELMKNFYGAMANENLTASEALRRAQVKLREHPQYRSPFYWAAFTVQGDFRNHPQISREAGFWFYLSGIVPLALIGFYLYRRRNYSTVKP